MKNRPISRAFTIIELLVVVSIIALLIGILLPAIGKARDNAKLTQSQANIKNVGTAMVSYGAEFNDRQPTWLDDNFSRYGTNFDSAFTNPLYTGAWPANINKYHCIGQNDQNVIYYWGGAARRYEPLNMAEKVGTFRLWHCRPMNAYVNGRVYDPTFYAPKDTVTLAAVETTAFENAGEWYDMGQNSGGATKFIYSSYCMSPAAMYSPTVFSKNVSSGKYWTNPYTMEAGHRSPAAGQAQYSSNKTWIMEHNWLQQRRNQICNPFITGSQLDCEPYYFNAVNLSSPVTFFFDGSIRPAGVGDAITADDRVMAQSGHGLWSRDTEPLGADGYFLGQTYEPWTQTSFHILTIDGIKGRDFIR